MRTVVCIFRNPFDDSTIASVADCDAEDVAAAVTAAADAFNSWRAVLPRQRSAYLRFIKLSYSSILV